MRYKICAEIYVDVLCTEAQAKALAAEIETAIAAVTIGEYTEYNGNVYRACDYCTAEVENGGVYVVRGDMMYCNVSCWRAATHREEGEE